MIHSYKNTIQQWEKKSLHSNVDESCKQNMAQKKKKPDTKEYILHNCVYIKFKNMANWCFVMAEVRLLATLGKENDWEEAWVGSLTFRFWFFFLIQILAIWTCLHCKNSLMIGVRLMSYLKSKFILRGR